MNLSSTHNAGTVELTVQDPMAEETINPPSALMHPESDSRGTTTPDNVGVSGQGAQSTANDDTLRDAVSRVLGTDPTRQMKSQVRKALGVICAELDEHLAPQKTVDGGQMAPPPRQPSVNKSKMKHRKSRAHYCCPECGIQLSRKHVFKRHIKTMHYPQYDYHCHLCDATSENPPHRRDKLLEHYTRTHGLDAPSPSIIDENRRSHLCPLFCKFCSQRVKNWDDFYDCFVKHCEDRSASSKASGHRDSHGHGKKRRRDDSDKGNFGSSTDNAGSASQGGYGQNEKPGRPFNPRSSGSGYNQPGRSKQQSGFSQQSSQPQLDLQYLQDQETSQGSRNQCKFCKHVFETCSDCCDSPSSTQWCHACPNTQCTLEKQAGIHQVSHVRGRLSQPIGVAEHVWANQQAVHDVNLSIYQMAAVNPSFYRAIPQGAQQLKIYLLQQFQSYGPLSGIVTQQRPFPGDQPWRLGAAHDVQAVGISELEIDHSISYSKKKTAQSSGIWSDALPFRSSPPPARQPFADVNIAPQLFTGPRSLNKVSFSSMCQCPCRTRYQSTYFARTGVDIVLRRMIETNFKMVPEARGLAHPLRTRIQVVIKMLRLCSSVAKSATGKNKLGAHTTLKEDVEAPLDYSESKAINSEESVKATNPDHIDYESDAESVTNSIFSVSSRDSSCNDLTLLSPGPSSPALKSSGIPSCAGLKLPTPARSGSPFCRNSDDDTNGDEEPIKVMEPFEEGEKELELIFDLDLLSSLNTLSRWEGVPSGNPFL